MLLSILLPLYNRVPLPLIADLQAAAAGLLAPSDWEICCLDDASSDARAWEGWLKTDLSAHANIRNVRAEQNLGRARARNRLAEWARGNWLLFLDGDMGFEGGTEEARAFLRAYLEAMRASEGQQVAICGGHRYTAQAPQAAELYLHWFYGSQREVRSVEERQKLGGSGFTSSNFAAPRALMLDLPFDANLRGYGHEDTLWGEAAKAQGVQFLHIESPVFHEGIERAEVFFAKSLQAVDTLRLLHCERDLSGLQIRLFQRAIWLRRWRIAWLMRLIFWLWGGFWRRHLLRARRINLLWFDLYRLGYLLRILACPCSPRRENRGA